MVCETFSRIRSPVHRIEPMVRLVSCVVLSFVLALVSSVWAASAGLLFGIFLCVIARLPALPLLKRLFVLNTFMVVLIAVFALTGEGDDIRLGPFVAGSEGMKQAGHIALRANAIVMILTSMMSTLDTITLAYTLKRLKVPKKLAYLLFFTVRYINLLYHEYRRLRDAMRVRCFRARLNMHTYKTVGNLVGMLLVKSFDRSERVIAAMKCRGFRGEFQVLDREATLEPGGRELLFVLLCFFVLFFIVGVEWIS